MRSNRVSRSSFLAASLTALALTLVGLSGTAMANASHQRMKDCNGEAKEKALKGKERKDFMKGCLKAAKAEKADARKAQQQKMKDCNASAKEKALKGKERKDFMKECLKG